MATPLRFNRNLRYSISLFKKHWVIVIFVLSSIPCFSQITPVYWYFGDSAGIIFNDSGVVVDTTSHAHSREGCGALMSLSGELLAYSTGAKIYNRQHDVMPHGDSLSWTTSPTQTGLFLQIPGSEHRFLHINTGQYFDTSTLFYSIVDFSLANGLGDVDSTKRNIVLDTLSAECLGYVHSSSHDGYWLISHRNDTSCTRIYKIDSNGINPNYSEYFYPHPPVILAGNTGPYAQGALSVSPNENTLVFTPSNTRSFSLLRINDTTGAVSFIGSHYDTIGPLHYSSEFSSDGSKLYMSGFRFESGVSDTFLIQYDMNYLPSVAAMVNNSDTFCHNAGCPQYLNTLKRGPSGKIYISNRFSNDKYLSVIHSPNETGSACNFEPHAIYLNGRKTWQGLPFYSYAQTYFSTNANNACEGDSVQFIGNITGAHNMQWDFDDTASGNDNYATGKIVYHAFSDTGTFKVVARFGNDSVIMEVYIRYRPKAILPEAQFLCSGSSALVNVDQPFTSFLWWDGDTVPIRSFNQPGVYTVQMSNECDTVFDTTRVISGVIPTVFLPADTTLCTGDSLQINPTVEDYMQYIWSTGDSSKATEVGSWLWPNLGEQQVWLEVQNDCDTARDSLLLTLLPWPEGNWFNDSILCGTSTPVIERMDVLGVEQFITYETENGQIDTLNPWEIKHDAIYTLYAQNACDTQLSHAALSPNQIIPDDLLGGDTTICPKDTVLISVWWPGASYSWNTGDTGNSIIFNPGTEGTTGYTVTISHAPCSIKDSKRIVALSDSCEQIPCFFYIPNAFTPNGDGLNDVFTIRNSCPEVFYTWTIHNRWQQKIATGNQTNNMWDGTVNGREAMIGSYALVIKYFVPNGVGGIYNARFILLR